METEVARAPELDTVGSEAEAAPVGRKCHGSALESRLHLVKMPHQLLAGAQRRTLLRGPGAELALARTRREIRLRFLACDRDRGSFDAHLGVERRPVKTESRPGIGRELGGLAAAQIREEREP